MTMTSINLSARPTLQVNVIYRSGSGEIDLDFPLDRLPEALADSEGTLWLDIEDHQGAPSPRSRSSSATSSAFTPSPSTTPSRKPTSPSSTTGNATSTSSIRPSTSTPSPTISASTRLDAFLARHYLVTYRTEPMPAVEKVRKQIERDPDNKLKRRPDHVLYLLLDQGVSEHLSAIEHLDEAIDDAQDEVFDRPTPATLQRIFQVKPPWPACTA